MLSINFSSKNNIKITDRIIIENDVGDLLGALNNGNSIIVKGKAEKYVADGMTAGEVIIYGDVSEGAGSGMYGGTLVIKGNSGDNLGHLLKGGTIIVGGNVGDFVGSFMIAGMIIIQGNAGKQLGNSMVGGVIYIKGSYESLGNNVEMIISTEDEMAYLNKLFKMYKFNTDQDVFKKIAIIKNGLWLHKNNINIKLEAEEKK